MSITLTHTQKAVRDLAEVTKRMRQGGFMSSDVSVVLRTDGERYWLAYVRDGSGADEFLRTTSVIGTNHRDVARYVSGFLTAVCAITGQTVMGIECL